ncbi:hypothetical protein SNE40_021593 [Patella caerulea]|uniref:Reelin domain-containing protein n=1 Tax=Patella caerulea TaxID=87958 RepID=A0AAN8G852_PATCE
MFTLKVALFVGIVAVCAAHMCMLSPAQRGSLVGFNKVGAADCYLKTGPCGGRPKSENYVTLKAMQNLTVVLQKNLDHYSTTDPGQFTISFGATEGSGMKMLGMIPDTSEQSLSLYAMNVTIPSVSSGQYVLQSVYITNNPKTLLFYECADIMIM